MNRNESSEPLTAAFKAACVLVVLAIIYRLLLPVMEWWDALSPLLQNLYLWLVGCALAMIAIFAYGWWQTYAEHSLESAKAYKAFAEFAVPLLLVAGFLLLVAIKVVEEWQEVKGQGFFGIRF